MSRKNSKNVLQNYYETRNFAIAKKGNEGKPSLNAR